jgi:predicted ester cyclase
MSEQNKALARRFYEEVFNKKNLKALDELCSADFKDNSPMPGQKAGVEGMKDMFGRMAAAFPDLHVTVDDLIAEGDLVAARLSIPATHKGRFMGETPTGKSVTFHGIDMIRVRGGKCVEATHFGDEMMVLAPLGARMG